VMSRRKGGYCLCGTERGLAPRPKPDPKVAMETRSGTRARLRGSRRVVLRDLIKLGRAMWGQDLAITVEIELLVEAVFLAVDRAAIRIATLTALSN